MSLAIAGMGWVTPLGASLSEVWQRLLNGETAAVHPISSPLGRTYPVMPVREEASAAHPRLRRSSAISRFAVAAGLAALQDAKLNLDAEKASRTALIFAVSNGGVIYTRRFYDQIVESGPPAASPLLFPETVFNAPASHLAAILGITGPTYTLVGDGAIGLLALRMAEDLMENQGLDWCLVAGAEETDWLLCDAYRKWRLLRAAPPVEPFKKPPRGTILSEGAGAVLLSRNGSVQLEKVVAGTNFQKQSNLSMTLEKVFHELCEGEIDLVVASANGTFIDAAERAAVLQSCSNANVYAMKGALGESVGASGLWQVICGAEALRTQRIPPNQSHPKENKLLLSMGPGSNLQMRRAIIPVCGLNQQVAGVRLVRS